MDECQKKEITLIKRKGGHLFPNVRSTLKELSRSNNLYIVSNCQAGYIETFLKFYNLHKYFKDFECSGNTNMDKIYNISLVMKRNELKQAIYVGDTIGDYIASINCNISFIYATYGLGQVNKSVYKINNFKELVKLCYNLKKGEK